MRENKFLFLAVVLALISGILCYQFLKTQSKREQVVVAKNSINQYTRIDSTMIELRMLHPDSIHPEAFRSAQEIIGNFAVTDFVSGEQILNSRVNGSDQYKDFAGNLGAQERAIFIPLTLKQNLGGAVSRADLVDIIYVAHDIERGFSVSKTILQRVQVLDVRSENGQAITDEDRSLTGGIVVALSLQDTEKIAYCLENGQLYIARQPYDGLRQSTEGVFYENVFRE
jgi:Flp pilus assembly protein CpaB